jgi:hypothetical protein
MLAVVLFAAAKPVGIPAHAIQIAPGTYRFEDKQGQMWIYRQTPFGLTHFLETGRAGETACATNMPVLALVGQAVPPASTGCVAPAAGNIHATAQGETIQFERPGPFGVYRWQRKESDLNQQERSVWLRQSESAAGQD